MSTNLQRISDLKTRIDKLIARAESGEHWADICKLEAEYIALASKYTKIGRDGQPTESDDYVAVCDRTTNLTWSRHTLDCGRVTYADAIRAAESFTLLGLTWDLPTRVQLLSLVDDTRFEPAIDPVFDCKSDWYWTRTLDASSPGDYAWSVSFSSGFSLRNRQYNGGFVRAVRVGQLSAVG